MTGRHTACDRCGRRLLTVDEFEGLAACSNPDCPSNHPTGPIPTITNKAAHEIEQIKRGLRERLDRGER